MRVVLSNQISATQCHATADSCHGRPLFRVSNHAKVDADFGLKLRLTIAQLDAAWHIMAWHVTNKMCGLPMKSALYTLASSHQIFLGNDNHLLMPTTPHQFRWTWSSFRCWSSTVDKLFFYLESHPTCPSKLKTENDKHVQKEQTERHEALPGNRNDPNPMRLAPSSLAWDCLS